MLWNKILACTAALGLCCGIFSGCSNKNDSTSSTAGAADSAIAKVLEATKDEYASLTFGKADNVDFADPKDGEAVAVIEYKDYGTVKFRLFPEAAPLAVENFVTLAQEGYYDGLTMHRIMEGFMIQGGDPSGDGTGGQSIYGEGFAYEISEKLRHFNGAVAYAHSALPDSNGSQFYIVTAESVPDDSAYYDQIVMNQSASGYAKTVDFSKAVKAKYAKEGGAPFLDGGYTVFGQVFEGQDVVDKIAADATNPSDPSGTASKKVIINKAYIAKYAK